MIEVDLTSQEVMDEVSSLAKSRILAYGPAGSGKTHLAGSTEGYIFDLDEHGYKTILKHGFKPKAVYHLGTCVNKRGENHPYKVYRKKFRELINQLDSKEVVVTDSCTALSELVLDYVIKKNKVVKPTQNEWGDIAKELVELLTEAKYAKCTTLFIAHEVAIKNEVDGSVRYYPKFGSVPFSISVAQKFDEVWYASPSSQSKYVLYTTRDVQFFARTCRNLPATIPNNFKKIKELLKGGETAKSKPKQ